MSKECSFDMNVRYVHKTYLFDAPVASPSMQDRSLFGGDKL